MKITRFCVQKLDIDPNGAEQKTDTANSYTFTGLTAETQYTIKVEAFDKVGNKGENSVKVSTEKKPVTVVEDLKEGDYVNYVDKNGVTRKCAVLYDISFDYGVQIVSMESLGNYWFGDTSADLSYSKIAGRYNNSIKDLNNGANNYLNTTYAISARSIGTIPNNPSIDTEDYKFSSEYQVPYNLKDGDSNYLTDYNQLKKLDLVQTIGGKTSYFFASRYVEKWRNESIAFGLYYSSKGREPSGIYFISIFPKPLEPGTNASGEGLYGVRPVFTLKSNIKITGGDGTTEHPYELGV